MSDKLILATPYGGVTPEWVDANDDVGTDIEWNAVIPEDAQSERLLTFKYGNKYYDLLSTSAEVTSIVNNALRMGQLSDSVVSVVNDGISGGQIQIETLPPDLVMGIKDLFQDLEDGKADVSPQSERLVSVDELEEIAKNTVSDEIDAVTGLPMGVPIKTQKYTAYMTYDEFKNFVQIRLNQTAAQKLFSVGNYSEGTEYHTPGRFWNVYINDELFQPRNGNAGGIAIEYDATSESGDLRVLPVEFEYKYVTLSVLVYGEDVVSLPEVEAE